jgi:hypothetical protein
MNSLCNRAGVLFKFELQKSEELLLSDLVSELTELLDLWLFAGLINGRLRNIPVVMNYILISKQDRNIHSKLGTSSCEHSIPRPIRSN